MTTASTLSVSAVRGVIRLYQLLISPVLGPRCRFASTVEVAYHFRPLLIPMAQPAHRSECTRQ